MVEQALGNTCANLRCTTMYIFFYSNAAGSYSQYVVSLPLSLFFLDSAIVNGVYWSEALNKVFVDNFERDPSLIWQYFGSAKGFFRQYPGKCLFVWDWLCVSVCVCISN